MIGADEDRKPEPVHRAGHLDVGEDEIDARARCDRVDRFLRGSRLDHLEAAVAQKVGDVEADEHFVLDDENDGCGGAGD